MLHNPRRTPQVPIYNDANAAALSQDITERSAYNNNSVIVSSGCLKRDVTSRNSAETIDKILADAAPTRCFLPVVNATLQNGNRKYRARTLLDSGSEINVISTRCYENLGLSGTPVTIKITGAGGVVTERNTRVADVSILDIYGSVTQLECIVMNEACGHVLSIEKGVIESIKNQVDVNIDNLVTDEGRVDLLIGLTSPQLHKQLALKGQPNQLHVIETLFGPCLVGPVPKGENGNYKANQVNSNFINIEIENSENENYARFLEAELAGINKECVCQTKSDDELQFEEAMKSSWSTSEDGRLEIRLPWKINPKKLANNRDIKLRLEKDKGTLRMFKDQIDEMIKGDILREVDVNYPKRYLPLLAVVNLERDSTKVRICLDSKTRFSRV